jgi:L(+)-tartrate dehydratase beta subunit
VSSKRLTFPTTEEAIRELRAGDEVLVDGHIIGIRDRSHIRIFDEGVEPPMDFTGAFLLHTAPGVRKVGEGTALGADFQEPAASAPVPSELTDRPATNVNPARSTARYEKVCIGTTTSARMVRFTEGLGRDYGVRAICGKGGLPDEAIEPMRKYGMVYFAIVGGAAALETTQIEEIEEVYWEELMPECLWKFRVRDFGPLTVGIDAQGNSLFHDVQERAKKKLEELNARL